VRPGLRYRCRHQEGCPSDVCLSIDYGDFLVEASSNGAVLTGIPLIFKASNRLAYLNLRLSRALERNEALSGEAIAIALWNAVVDSGRTPHQRRYTRPQLVCHPFSRRFRLPSVGACQNHVAVRSCHSVFFLLTVGDPAWPLP
jgi:hypothetical protein